MSVSPVFQKHMVRPVPDRAAVPVDLLVGDERRRLEVGRPMVFNEMTLLSDDACSKRTKDIGGFGPRALTKHSISRWGKPVGTDFFFDTRYIEPNNVSHLLLDIIPLCLRVRSVVDEVTFVFRPLAPRFRELLAHFGIEPLCTYRPIIGRRLSFRLSRGLAHFEIGPDFDAPVYSYTGEVYSDYFRNREGAPKIFVSRRGSRSPVNAAELNAFLEARGFTIVYLEDHCIAEQIAVMQAAEDVVAIHGAAMAYLALKNRTRSMIELLPPNVYHDHFPLGVGHKVDKFIQLIPTYDEEVQFSGWPAILRHKQQPFSVDLAQLEQALDG